MTAVQRLRGIVAGSAGNLVEYYDWYVYSAFSLYFAHVFFPEGDPTTELLHTAAIFAVGFLMRPIGGWLMGIMADRHGRRAALSLSILTMSLGSMLIVLCPGYDRIGVAAPVVLVVARLIQGLSLGGEYGASATYLSEVAPPGRRGFYSSFQYVTLVMGQLLALLVLLAMQFALLTPQQIAAWGWRVPFGIGALLSLSVLWLRRDMHESTQFTRTRATRQRGGLRALIRHPKAILTVCGLTLGGTVAFYTYTIYMQKYLVNTLGFPRERATLIAASALFVFALAQPAFGALSDRIGRRPLLIGFGLLGTFGTVPLMRALSAAHGAAGAFALLTLALLAVSGYTAINAVVKAEQFPTRIRALGVAFPYAMTVSLFGGTAEYIALWSKQAGHEDWFYWYVSACALCSLLTVLFLLPRRGMIDGDGTNPARSSVQTPVQT
ncbi:MFS transporter [Nguyenibacter vanlangensis]|uniref:MFS transporter n=1 Tax=Nguyenibacter vanlangensis TaxID=1216886 RepID=A0ABZ3DC83_9PROT